MQKKMEEREVKDFYFRQLRKVNVGDPVVGPEGRHSLLCTSNEFGLTFVGCGDGVRVFETSVLYLVDQDENIRGPRNAMADVSSLEATIIRTPAPPLHVSLSCDSLTLCVALRENSILKCLFFDTRAYSRKVAPITPFASIDLTTHQVIHLTCLQWNPALPDTLALSLSNELQLLVVKDDVVTTVTKKLSANAICWSPKGKQLAVGLKDGSLVQLSSKDLEQKKAFPCPDIFEGDPQQISDLHWISTYMFAVVYTPRSSTNGMPSFVFLSAPKGATPQFVNYEDVYYGTGTRQEKFYFTYISKWGVLISSSANAIDTAVFAQPDDKWEKWELEDTGRAEMPLDKDNNETFAAGMALDLTSQTNVAINESTSLPPSPLLLLYSDQGVLCPYTVINTGCPPSGLKELVIPPRPLPSGPVRQPPISTQDQNRPPQQPQASSQPLLGTLSQGFTPVSYTQPGSSSAPPPHSSRPQFAITTASTSGLGLSPLTMGGMTLGGNKLGSTTQPSYSQFSVSALTGGQPFRPPPPSYSRPQLQASSASPGLSLRPGAPVQRPPGAAPPLATAGSLTDSLSVTRGVQQSGQLPPPYVAPITSVPQPQPAVHTPASQPAPNVSMPSMTMQPPRATRPLDQSFQLAGMPPLFSSTPLAPMGSRPPAAQASGVPLHVAAPRATTGLQSQQHSQPGIPPPSMVAPPTYPQPRVLPPSMVAPPTYPQPGSLPPSMVAPPTYPQSGVPPPSLVSPPTYPQPGSLPPSMVAPPTYPQPGSLPPSMVAPPTYPQPGVPPPSMVSPPTRPQPGAPHPSMVAPPTYPQPGVPPSVVTPPTRPQPGVPPPSIVSPPTYPQPGIHSPSMVHPPTRPQPGIHSPSMVHPPTRPQPGVPPPSMVPPPGQPRPTAPPMFVSKQQSPPKAAQDDTEYGDHFKKIEASFSQSIQDEIEKFADRLELLKDELRDDFGEWEDVEREEVKVAGLGSMEDLRQLCEEAQEMEEGVQDIVKATKALERSCDQLGDDTLRGYEISEEVKANLKKKNDPNYISLLKLRPLDAYNARHLDNIRSLFLQVKQTAEEVNSQLNAEMEKRYEERRQRGRSPMKAPSVQTIYSSLRTNRKIARMQSANIERITNNMKRLKLIPQSWHPADVVSATSPTSEKSFREASTSPAGSLRQPDRELESPTWKTIPADKSKTLRDYLSSIEHVPVIRVKSTRFVLSGRQRDHSGTSTPQESGHWDGTEIPYSYPDGPASVVDSERASTVDVQTPTSQQYGGLPGLSGGASMPAQPVVQLLSHSSLAQPSASSLGSQSTVDVLIVKDQQIKVLTSERSYIVTASPSKYQQTPPSVAQSGTVDWGGSPSAQPRSEDHTPQPPTHFPLQHTISTTTYTSTAPSGLGVLSVQLKPSGHPSPPSSGAPSADRPHTVVWGAPSTAPIPNPQQPSFPPTTQPSLQLGGLRRAEPFSNLTKIQPSGGPGSSTSASNPLASTTLAQNVIVTKSETSKLLSTASALSSTNAISTTNQVSSTFSFSIGATKPLTSMGFMPSGNPAMTIKPTAGLAGSTGPSGLNLFGATSSQVQQKASPTLETKPPGSSLSVTGVTTTTTSKTTSTATPSFSSLFANLPTFSTTTNFASPGGGSSTFPFQFGLKTQPTADAATEKTAPGIASSGVTKTDSKPPPTETKFGPAPSKDFLGSLLSQPLSSSVKTGSLPSASIGSTPKASAATTTASSTDVVFGSMSTSSLKLSSLSSVSLKAPVAPVLPTSKAAPGKEEDSGGESQETESEALKDVSPVNENPQDTKEPDVRAPPDQLGPYTGLHKMSAEADPSKSTSMVNTPFSGFGTVDKSPLVPVSRGERKTDSEDKEVVKDEKGAAEQVLITPEQTETEITLQPPVEQATKKENQVGLPLLQAARTQTTGNDNSTSINIPTSSQPSTLPPPFVTKDSPLLPSSSLTTTSPTVTPGTNTSTSVNTATAAAIQVATHAATDKTVETTEKKAELKKMPSISQEPAKDGDKVELSRVSTPATQQTQLSGPGGSSGIEIKQHQTGGSLSLLGQPLSGSQGSLQSAGGEEQEMEEMGGDMENEMEPIEMNSSQQQPQPSTGGLFTLNSFGGLGGKASNPTANPFGSFHSSSSSSTTSTSAFQSSGRGGILKPPSGSFSTPSQQPPMRGVGVGIGGTSSQVGTSSVMERTHLQGSSFGGGPVFGNSPSPAAFGSPALFGTTLSANGMQGRIFGAGSNTGTSGLFQQSGNANELSFGSLARQPPQSSSQGFGAGAGTGFGGPTPMSGQPQFSAWRK